METLYIQLVNNRSKLLLHKRNIMVYASAGWVLTTNGIKNSTHLFTKLSFVVYERGNIWIKRWLHKLRNHTISKVMFYVTTTIERMMF